MPELPPAKRFPWYDLVEGSELQQGDIISRCPVIQPIPGATPALATLASEFEAEVLEATGVVLTQSCDLAIRANGSRHVRDVVFRAVYSKPEVADHERFGKPNLWEDARKGRCPAYHVLNCCELEGHLREFLIVDFTRVFTVPIGIVDALIGSGGPRLRLNPPYREHLAQAFARFFMRVGLPVDIPPFR